MQNHSICVIGASGHARVVIQLARACGLVVQCILDDDQSLHGSFVLGVPVHGGPNTRSALDLPSIIAIGSNSARRDTAERLDRNWVSLVHPSAIVDPSVVLEPGVVVMAGAVVQANTHIGRHSIVNTVAAIDHDCRLGEFSHVCPGAVITGGVTLHEGAFFGAHATAIPGVIIEEWSTVGAGAVVIETVAAKTIVAGVPARLTRHIMPHVNDIPKRICLKPPVRSALEQRMISGAFEDNRTESTVYKFESEFAKAVDTKTAIATNSFATAVQFALRTLGVKEGDCVLTSSLPAKTAAAIKGAGVDSVLVDSNASTWTLDPHRLLQALKEAGSSTPRVLVVGDVLGHCADYNSITKICRDFGVLVLEDASEALGAKYHGRPAGSFGDIACFALDDDNIISVGGGGVIVTSDPDLSKSLNSAFRLDNLHHAAQRLNCFLAAMARGQLARLPSLIATHREIFDWYDSELRDIPGLKFIPEQAHSASSRLYNCIKLDEQAFGASRESLIAALEDANIESRTLWHTSCRSMNDKTNNGSVAEALQNSALCLPSGTDLNRKDFDRIANIIRSICKRSTKPTPLDSRDSELVSMDINLITSKEDWNTAVDTFESHDVYHTYEYSRLSKQDGDVIGLLHVFDNDRAMALPVLTLTTEIAGSRVTDMGSVYGYPGPLFKGQWSDEALQTAWEDVRSFLAKENIVSLVSRLNPFSGSSRPNMTGVGKVAPINPVVAIDLRKTEEEQRLEYRSNHRRDIKKLIKNGFSCEMVDPETHLDCFIDLYNETMGRLNAKDHYYFDKDYFKRLFDADKFDTTLFIVFDSEGVATCGGIFFTTGKTLHYHLGATKTEFLRSAPTKLLFDTVRSYAHEIKCQYFNLGGGVGGGDDSLYRFKAGFSKMVVDYCVFMAVFDQNIYDNLVDQREQLADESAGVLDSNFLPRYRAPIVSATA